MKTILFTVSFSFIATTAYLQISKLDKRDIASVDKYKKESRTFTNINYTRSMITLDSSIEYKGLTNSPGRDGEYMKRLFGKLIQKADEYSREKFYKPDIGVYKNYHTFLLAVLQVPYHESSLTHFINRDVKKCALINRYSDESILQGRTAKQQLIKEIKEHKRQRDNSVVSPAQKASLNKLIKKKQAWIDKIVPFIEKNMPKFYAAYGKGKNIFKDCAKFKNDTSIQQILFSNDYADVGMFMFNAPSHPKVFSDGDIFDFDKTINYGIGYLYNGHNNSGGFVSIVENANSYSCLRGLEQSNPKKFALRLIRGIWAGQYNSGNTSQTCRFQNRSHKWAKNDRKFFKDLRTIYDEDFADGSLWHKHLPANSYEEKAFFELINNVVNQTNNRRFLDLILKTDYNARDTISYENIPVEEPEVEVESSQEVTITTPGQTEVVVDITETVEIPEQAPVVTEVEATHESGDESSETVEVVEVAVTNTEETSESTEEANGAVELIENLEETVTEVTVTKDESENVRPEDVTGDLPLVLDFKKTHVVIGSSVNIRKSANLGRAEICGNTSLRADDSPVQISVISEGANSEFFKISKTFVEDLIKEGPCKQHNEFYIHKDYVDEIREYNIIGKVNVKTFIPIRLGPGSRAVKTDRIIHPGVKVITDEKIYSNKYVWYEFVDEDGQRRWFYAGENGKHVEFLNE